MVRSAHTNSRVLSECEGESGSGSKISDDKGKCRRDPRYGVKSAEVALNYGIEGLFRY